jgi:hypothetical protein
MLVVRFYNFVKGGAFSAVTRVFDALWRRRLRRSTTLDEVMVERCATVAYCE